ncbi:VOC family protein [Streptomyces sp. MP131-18]|uniref:VOC family protein n=1 Tax=Streptomyces sp. MP131-18 TaxID=1857892 RepID=UPI00097C1497|nr:VOC family protein [Streptomyces sp. MP131-18]ONK16098.1 putative lactoylglutathione lyase [Streptomyces sp. MP131-18]
MTLSLDAITLGVPEVHAAQEFYSAAFSPATAAHGQYVDLDMHGAGRIALHGAEALAADADAEPATSGFRGYVMSCVVSQPSEVEALLDAAVLGGADVLKPAKKGLFGGFSAVCRAPDGAIWKLSAPTKKDTGPAAEPPVPTETAALLGVAAPTASKAFYAALGMTVDRDYGDKYIDFRPAPGTCRLGLMTRKALARDAGVGGDGAGFRAVALNRRAESREEADALLAAADSAGGHVVVAAAETEGGYSGYFTDPDGFLWQVASA